MQIFLDLLKIESIFFFFQIVELWNEWKIKLHDFPEWSNRSSIRLLQSIFFFHMAIRTSLFSGITLYTSLLWPIKRNGKKNETLSKINHSDRWFQNKLLNCCLLEIMWKFFFLSFDIFPFGFIFPSFVYTSLLRWSRGQFTGDHRR